MSALHYNSAGATNDEIVEHFIEKCGKEMKVKVLFPGDELKIEANHVHLVVTVCHESSKYCLLEYDIKGPITTEYTNYYRPK